jgi:hypothetical protein
MEVDTVVRMLVSALPFWLARIRHFGRLKHQCTGGLANPHSQYYETILKYIKVDIIFFVLIFAFVLPLLLVSFLLFLSFL